MNPDFVEFDTFLKYDSRLDPWMQFYRMGKLRCRIERIQEGLVKFSYHKKGLCIIEQFCDLRMPYYRRMDDDLHLDLLPNDILELIHIMIDHLLKKR